MIRKFLLALGLILVSSAAWSAEQFQPAVIAVINVQEILQDTAAAKSIRSQIDAMRNRYQEEVNKRDQDLRQQEQELKTQQTVLSQQAFNEKRRDFQQRVAEAQRDVQERLRDLDELQVKGLNEIRKAMLPIIVDLSKESGFNIVMANTQIVFATKQLDITDTVVKRLDASLPIVNLAAQGAAQPAAQPRAQPTPRTQSSTPARQQPQQQPKPKQ